MSAELCQRVKEFLQALEPTQDELIVFFGKKRTALRAAQQVELVRLVDSEAELAKQMQRHLGRRQQILQQARQSGLPSDSILTLVVAIGGDQREQLEQRIQRARTKSEKIRTESWIHWIVTQRALNHFSELLDLIAHCGRQAPTYSQGPSEETTGGAILDASI
jgi:hypothetical protein